MKRAVTAPLWTAFTWAGGRRTPLLLGLVALVQGPAAVFAFAPIADPVLHALALVTSLGITAISIVYV